MRVWVRQSIVGFKPCQRILVRTVSEERRIEVMKHQLRELRRTARRMQEHVNKLEEQVNILEEEKGND